MLPMLLAGPVFIQQQSALHCKLILADFNHIRFFKGFCQVPDLLSLVECQAKVPLVGSVYLKFIFIHNEGVRLVLLLFLLLALLLSGDRLAFPEKVNLSLNWGSPCFSLRL